MRRLLLALPLAACVNTIEVTTDPHRPTAQELRQAQSVVAGQMKDPASVQFRGDRAFTMSNGDVAFCGEVNAKNSYGGYTGFEPYWVRMRGGAVASSIFGNAARDGCNEAAMGRTTVSS